MSQTIEPSPSAAAKHSRKSWWIAAVGVVLASAAVCYFASREAPGHATPEEAAKAFLAAIASGDRDAIRRELYPECRARVAYAEGYADYLALVKPLGEA